MLPKLLFKTRLKQYFDEFNLIFRKLFQSLIGDDKTNFDNKKSYSKDILCF